jgi:hypothetical protein
MKQFVRKGLPDGAPCTEMGDHFPFVCRDGKPVQIAPPKVRNANSPAFDGVAEISGFHTTMGGKATRAWKRDG